MISINQPSLFGTVTNNQAIEELTNNVEYCDASSPRKLQLVTETI